MEARIKITCCITNQLAFDRRMIRVCRALSENGFDVELIGRKTRNSGTIEHTGFSSSTVSTFFKRGFLFYLEFNLHLLATLLFKSMHIIYAVDPDTLPACVFASKIKRTKLIYDAHEWFDQVPEVERRPFISRFWRILTKWGVKYTDARITVGSVLAKTFEKQHGLKFGVVRNMPDFYPSHPISDLQPKKALVYLGALNEGRGLETALHAMTELVDFQLWLIGEGDLSAKLRALAKQLHVQDRVIFYGYKTEKEWRPMLQNAFAGLNLLESRSNSYYYSLANKFFDYIHAGIPGIHMLFPEYTVLNEEIETSVLIELLEPSILVNAVRKLQDDPVLYERLQKNCKEAAAQWNWSKEQHRLVETVKEIL